MQVLDYLRTVPDSLGGGVDLDGMSMSSSPDSWNTVMLIMVCKIALIVVAHADCLRQQDQRTGHYTRHYFSLSLSSELSTHSPIRRCCRAPK
jgi:hypothetical protein